MSSVTLISTHLYITNTQSEAPGRPTMTCEAIRMLFWRDLCGNYTEGATGGQGVMPVHAYHT